MPVFQMKTAAQCALGLGLFLADARKEASGWSLRQSSLYVHALHRMHMIYVLCFHPFNTFLNSIISCNTHTYVCQFGF